MTMHLERDLDRLRKHILVLGSVVEEATNKAIESLYALNLELAEEVMSTEIRINELEVDIEEECLKILALHQPVAGDLRFIVAVLKVNNDLERMGDLAQNIAERVQFLATREPLPVNLDFRKMAELVRDMLRMSLDSLVRQDAQMAHQILTMDDSVDDLNAEMFAVLQSLMKTEPAMVESAVSTLSASRHLERIADLATNIAEYVIFMQEGVVIRHQLHTED
jgi:phosphate transport system protein